MNSLSVLILCTLLQTGNDNIVPQRQPDVRQPVAQPTQMPPSSVAAPVVVPPTVPPVVALPSADPNQLQFQNGILELPRYSRITLSARHPAELTSLKTEQRDAAGNPVMVPLREGMNVVRGQVLGNLDDQELRSLLKIGEAQLEVAEAEKEKELEIVVAAHAVRVAMSELITMREVNKKVAGAVTAFEIQRAEMAQLHAEANLALQKYILAEIKTREVTVRESELNRTKVQIEQRKLVAPIDGMIVKIDAAEGEMLREGQPVLELMQLDTMRVRVDAHADKYAISDLDGKKAIIQVTLANSKMETFQGEVVFCDPEIKAGGTFDVYIEVQNRRVGNYWLLQPGKRGVDIVILL
jgi:multidrug efflux pump subunit AcrA (membrane-fusion protein)